MQTDVQLQTDGNMQAYCTSHMIFLFFVEQNWSRFNIVCVYVLPSGSIMFTLKIQARTNPTERNNHSKKDTLQTALFNIHKVVVN